MPRATADERVGTIVGGRYRIERLLGRGGSGSVHEAVHTWTGRRVAVKILHADLARNLKLVRRFVQEARAIAALDHPHVVEVLDAGTHEDGSVYLALELARGEPLHQIADRRGRLSPAEALSILVPVMHGLGAAHAAGIIHRDLKLENVLVAAGGDGLPDAKLIDFGMARVLESGWGRATERGVALGTPLYMSPEQARGEPDVGPQTDVWSMGVLLYRLLSGEFPYPNDVPGRLLTAIARQPPRPLQGVAPDVPAPLAEAVDGALVHDLAARHPTMDAFREALIDAARASGVEVRVTEGKSWGALRSGSYDAAPGPTSSQSGIRGRDGSASLEPPPVPEASTTPGRPPMPWIVAGVAIVALAAGAALWLLAGG